jgi:hypothetical protein
LRFTHPVFVAGLSQDIRLVSLRFLAQLLILLLALRRHACLHLLPLHLPPTLLLLLRLKT